MGKPYEQQVEEIREDHIRMRLVFDTRPISGERTAIPRAGKEPVDVLVYRPERHAGRALPAVFNMHGGAFIAGDAVLMDSFCRMLSETLPAMVFNVNYKKAPEYPFPYAIEEVYDAVAHVAARAEEYGVDPGRMAVGGHSAGASLAAAVALKAKEEGEIELACQLLVYPCTDLSGSSDKEADSHGGFVSLYCQNNDSRHRWASPLKALPEELKGICPAVFVICGVDKLRSQGEAYAKKLIDCGVPVAIKRFEGALHGFVEVNRPDYWFEDERKSPAQAEMCREAEEYIVGHLRAFIG